MNKLLSEAVKVDVALTSAALNGAGTGQYFNMRNYRKALFVWELGTMAAAATSVGQIMQAQDAAPTGAKVITNAAATVTANANAASVTLTLATVLNGQTVTINGIVFTAHTDTTTPAAREFAIDGNDTADAAALAGLINDSVYGVPGVLATPASAVITLTSEDPGETAITAAASDSTVTIASTRALGYVEIDSSYLDDANGFTHVALRVTNSASLQTSAVLVRGVGRYSPRQVVAAAKTDVEE